MIDVSAVFIRKAKYARDTHLVCTCWLLILFYKLWNYYLTLVIAAFKPFRLSKGPVAPDKHQATKKMVD